ncbi:M23 family metallopeptidase [Blastococcus sp. TML/M2B]|uniref:peptidoglycan DD-metalloendopeptidase family protein n=1 Tax=unclassified Blastococcus TaxID=2619396 RepID=UPI00190A1038|nr:MULTISPECIES: M23 family metallopeptidase [unclassified Blastococcus]MBN1094173.1 M23 family metallopeptidase [Blastococcus sp. TML/M2B]MBN1095710.1 M23 family metallopeptidase [Blastococcus sp. TML/C7B]
MFHRRPPHPASARLRATLVALAAGTVLVVTATPALAVPPPPPNPTDGEIGAARSQQDAAAAEVGRIAGLVATAEAELERLGVQAEAAGTAYEAANEALQVAQGKADEAAAQLQVAADAVAAAQARIAVFSRDSYMQGASMSTSAVLLSATGPDELIQRAAMLDYVGANKVDVLGEMEVARIAQAEAEAGARAARDEMAAAEESAAAAKAQADSQVAVQRGAYAEIEAQKDVYQAQLDAANIALLELQGARNAYQQWQQQKAAEEAAQRAAAERAAAEAAAAAAAARNAPSRGGGGASAGSGGSSAGPYVKPTSGRVSSCFGTRWGALHGGVDIAAPIGTPIYAAHSGVVQRAGTASGFGYAVWILGDDGYVTVYGHVNQYFVRAGDRVRAGEEIAEVGNRGESTGPHLHFEVHPRGVMYGGHADPVPWLRARGIELGGC